MIGNIEKSFLLDLTQRLAEGLAELEPERAARHSEFLLRFQQPDGGFSGREGGSDLYYTSFAVRGLALLNSLDDATCAAITGYLKKAAGRERYNLIDLVSWFYSVITIQLASDQAAFDGDEATVTREIASSLETFRRPDGGYAKTAEGGSGSTYHTFLAVLCYELLGHTPPEQEQLAQFLLTRQRDDGGFVEIGPMKRSGTNPTAAAAVLLNRLGEINEDLKQKLGDYLLKVKGGEGGLRANTQIPFSDLLSTFTGLLMAHDLDLLDRLDLADCRRYVEQLELRQGGFRGAGWDNEADPEYTFYGLGTVALLGTEG